MSQQLNPVDGGVVPFIQTTVVTPSLNILSRQYIETFRLEERPTEWAPGGRPIYRRLPAISETYQINFFNVVSESNLVPEKGIEKIGYVYIPWGESDGSPTSVGVVASTTKDCVLVKAGNIVWEYGKTAVLPTIINLRNLEVAVGRYEIAYQLIYDDAPISNLYEVEDFALTGLPLNISSSADSIVGWRYPAVNAFLNTSTNFWKNTDTYYPSYAQPTSSFLSWSSEMTQGYRKIVLRCPPDTAFTGTATLSYVNNSVLSEVTSTSIQKDSTGQFFEIVIPKPQLQTGWRIDFSSLDVAIQSITVSGLITLKESQAEPSPKAVLAMYPSGTLPKTTTNSNGEKIPVTYCVLAEIEVGKDYNLTKVIDQRQIIHRDYTPIADWLTKPFDSDLIDLYEQVSGYSQLWMNPTKCMKQEYLALEEKQIKVEV